LWALSEDKARNEIFNVSNGDVYRWRQLWNELAAFYDLPIAEPLAMSTVSEMSEKAPLWDSMVARYGLHATPYNQIANWAFVDWMLNFREETILSTIKIRQAGFADCIDTHQSFRRQLTRLRDLRIIPAPMYPPDVHIVANSGLAWSDFMPAGFDPGMKLAVINGDPGKTGDYTVRLQFPAGYKFPVHWHPGAENLTVVSGEFQLGMGNTANENTLRNYGPGDYIYIPPGHAHFGGSAAQGPSVIQLHGEGPFQVMLGAPK
jgi:quercetin dioxygenase-like cupin family protein